MMMKQMHVCTLLISSLLAGCTTGPIRYSQKSVLIPRQVEMYPSGAVLISASPQASSLIHSSNEVMIVERTWKQSEFWILPIPLLPSSIGLNRKDYSLPDDIQYIQARWPSGAIAPVGFKPFKPYYNSDLIAKHPDEEKQTRRWSYDLLLRSEDRVQTVYFKTVPPSGMISFDGTNYIGNSVKEKWQFTYDEYAMTQKLVAVYARWPSGATAQSNTIPIASKDYARYIYDLNTAHVDISHPLPASKQYEYDLLDTPGHRSRRISATFQSSPRGASIYSGGKLMGKEPIELGSEITFDDYQRGYVQWSITAVWDSQVEKTETFTVRIPPINQSRSTPAFVFNRPSTKTGNDTDILVEKRLVWKEAYARNPPESSLMVKSDPAGATLYIDGNNVGQAPTRLSWTFTESEYLSNQPKTLAVTARWPSGATVSSTHVILINSTNSHSYVRPTSFPNIELDVKYALEYSTLREIQGQQASRELSALLDRQRVDRMESEARSARMLQDQAERQREHNEQERYREQEVARQKAHEQVLREDSLRRRQYENEQLFLQRSNLAETERANRAREDANRRAATMQSMQMLTDQLNRQNIPQPETRNTYEIRPRYPSFDEDPMTPGSYHNPYIIERK